MFKRRRYAFERTRKNQPSKIILEQVTFLQYFPETMTVSFDVIPKNTTKKELVYWTWIGKIYLDETGLKNVKYHDCENLEGEIVSYYEFIKPITLYWINLEGEEVNMVTNSNRKRK